MMRWKSNLFLLSVFIFISFLNAQELRTKNYIKSYTIDEYGNRITISKVSGYPPEKLPVSNYTPPKTMEKGIFFALDNVPGYSWSYGAMPTAAAMLVAYYDHLGVEDAYTGTEGSGLAPMTNATWNSQASTSGTDENPIAGTNQDVDGRDKRGHSDDYWTDYGDEATDPYYGAWSEHIWYENDVNSACTADYMGTNQWYNWENSDGSTSIWSSGGGVYDYVGSEASTPALRDGIHGLRLFWEALGYTVDLNYTRTISDYNDPDDDPDEGPMVGGFTFEMYMNEIDQGLPVIVQIEGHSMTGYGYDNTNELAPKVIIRDTWSYDVSDTHVMDWMGLYSNMQHYAISVIHLGTESGWFAPQNVLALNNDRTVTVNWDDPSKGGENMNYEVYRDDVLQATVATEQFIEVFTSAGDGLHTYYVKSIYVDEPYTTLPSMSSSVIVCASVTEFHDDFESGDGDWMLSDGWGLCQEWVYGGSNSLSESPNADYLDNTDQLAMGGSVGEIAPGLNFSAAADASMDFWYRYDIEVSFDYMHLQTCKDGINWVSIKVWDGETPAWAQENISLGLYAGESNVRIRFLFVSDPGYTTEGSNIDDLNIVPSTTDLAPPYVFYAKDKDYFDNNPEGFEVTSEITDFTGIDYANIVYSVNGGGDQTVSSYQILGDIYYFIIPEQTPGDHVEFWFECRDTAAAQNTGTTAHHEYYAGLHQKYDDGIVSYYSELVTTTAQYDYVAHANKCTSFYEDVVGVVVRGYDDVSQPDDNSDLIIHVWADNAGMPGADLITPLQVPNPATLSETNKWAYIDLSSYTELEAISGDYFVGITCATGGPSDVTRTTSGAPSEYQGYDYGKAYLQLYMENGSALTWEKETGTLYHIRAVTTNYQLSPGIIVANPDPLAKTVELGSIATEDLTLTNEGGFAYDYSAVIDYTVWPGQKGDVTVESNDFESGLVYTNNPGAWSAVGGVAQITTQGIHTLESGVFDGTTASALSLDFTQNSNVRTGGYTNVEYSINGGTDWVQVYNVTVSNTTPAHITLPNVTNDMKIRFIGNITKSSGQTGSWAIDNVLVYGPQNINFDWLDLDQANTAAGTVTTTGNDVIEIEYDCSDTVNLQNGDYVAEITFTAPGSDTVVVPVNLTIGIPIGGDPAVPANVVTSISGSDLVIDWDVSADATGYDVYTSDDPYGTFSLTASVGTNQYTVAADQAKLFYYIVATNAAKAAPKTIKRSATR
ncbi:MAG: hypothetical protein GQ534_00825 [Candidatus Delongbacteria bacterium]|nr:hypothetical protein [Candidatus Delongbacteria bacterium]